MKNKKITVGLFIDSFYPFVDGVVLVVDNYAKKLTKYCNVVVFCPKYSHSEYDDSIFPYKVVRCHSIKIPTIDYSLSVPNADFKFLNSLSDFELDIVHIHSPFTIGKIGVKYAKRKNIPVIATMHSQFKRDFKKAVKNDMVTNMLTKKLIHVFDECDECWAVNKEVARIFHEEYGYKKLPIVMGNATEMLPIKDFRKACELINKKYILTDEKVLIFVGRINNIKNIFFIVEALALVHKRVPNLNFKMFFIGCGQDEDNLKNLIRKKHMTRYIKMCGKITDRELLASFYARSDLFLFPSLYDSSSIVQIEAASQKTPVLFIDGSATASTVTKDVNGFTAKNNISDYANAIIRILNNDKNRKIVGANAYRDLYKNWDDNIKDVYNRYNKLIAYKKNTNFPL